MEIRGGTRNNESMATGARRRGSNWLETQQKNVRVVHVFSTIGIDGGFAQPAPSAPPLPLLHRGKKNADWILSAGNSKPSGWLHLESIINFVVQPRPPPVNRRHVPQARRSLLVRRPLTWRDPQINRCTSDPQQSNQKKKIKKKGEEEERNGGKPKTQEWNAAPGLRPVRPFHLRPSQRGVHFRAEQTPKKNKILLFYL